MTNMKYDPIKGMRTTMGSLKDMEKSMRSNLTRLTNDANAAMGNLPDNCTDADAVRLKEIQKELVVSSKNLDGANVQILMKELHGIYNK